MNVDTATQATEVQEGRGCMYCPSSLTVYVINEQRIVSEGLPLPFSGQTGYTIKQNNKYTFSEATMLLNILQKLHMLHNSTYNSRILY